MSKRKKHRSRAARAASLTPKVQRVLDRAIAAHHRGDLASAEADYTTVLGKSGGEPTATQNLGLIWIQAGREADALKLYETSLTRFPNAHGVRFALADWMFHHEQFRLAEPHFLGLFEAAEFAAVAYVRAALCAGYVGKQTLALERLQAAVEVSQDVDHWADVGTAARLIGATQFAVSIFERVVQKRPRDGVAHASLGMCRVDQGDMDGAEACLSTALALRPGDPNAWFARVGLRRFGETDREVVTELERVLESAPRGQPDWATLSFAMAKVQHDLGNYERAFVHYTNGNEVKHRTDPYRRDANAANLSALLSAFSEELCALDGAFPTDLPVLIVGMPRSGTTLVEQILASHHAVVGAGELPDLAAMTRELLPAQAYPSEIGAVTTRELRTAAQRYVEKLTSIAAADGVGIQRVTDKMPTNFLQLGLARLLFGRLRVIHCRRDPMDTCFSNYIQLFAQGHRYSTSLEDTAHFYGLYRRLMAHWDVALPGQILHVDYENVVQDLEREARRMVRFLELPWDPQCLNYFETERTVETASNWQVRQPIYTQSRKRWRRYEPQLEPLKAALSVEVPGIELNV